MPAKFFKLFQNKFNIFLAIALIVVLAAGVLAWLNQSGQLGRVGSGDSTTQDNLTSKISVNLTDSQRATFEGAIKKFQDQIARGDSQGEKTMLRPYLYLGINYESLGELELARQAYLKAAEVNGASDIPWSNLGSLYQQMGSLRLAKEALKTAVRLNPYNSLVWQKLIELYFKMNETDANIYALYDTAIEKASAKTELIRDYALYLEQKGNIDKAMGEWQILLAKATGAQANGIKSEIERLKGLKKK